MNGFLILSALCCVCTLFQIKNNSDWVDMGFGLSVVCFILFLCTL